MKPVNEMVVAINYVLTALTNRENEIKKQGELIKEKIRVMVEEMIDILHQSEKKLTREVDTVTCGKLQVLSQQKNQLK